jgi:hypothetical protein
MFASKEKIEKLLEELLGLSKKLGMSTDDEEKAVLSNKIYSRLMAALTEESKLKEHLLVSESKLSKAVEEIKGILNNL